MIDSRNVYCPRLSDSSSLWRCSPRLSHSAFLGLRRRRKQRRHRRPGRDRHRREHRRHGGGSSGTGGSTTLVAQRNRRREQRDRRGDRHRRRHRLGRQRHRRLQQRSGGVHRLGRAPAATDQRRRLAAKGARPASSGGAAGSSTGFVPYVCPSGMSSPSASAIPAGSTATRIAGAPPMDTFDGSQGNGFTNVEGPVWIGDALYFSEMLGSPNPPPSRILKIDSSGTVTQFYPPGSGGDSGSNGMAVDSSGDLVTANHGVGGIVSFTVPGGTKTTIIDSFGGKRFNSPNDLTIRSDGTIYFTDPVLPDVEPDPTQHGRLHGPAKLGDRHGDHQHTERSERHHAVARREDPLRRIRWRRERLRRQHGRHDRHHRHGHRRRQPQQQRH